MNFYYNDGENSTMVEYDIIELGLLDSGINDVDFPLNQIEKLFELSDVIKFEQKEDVKQAHKLTLPLNKNKYEVDSIQVLLMPYNIDIAEGYKTSVKSYLGGELMNKTKLILEHLKNNEGITSIQAFELYGATRLSAIIFNLRKAGYIIRDNWKTGKDRYGNSCRFVEYKLIGKENE